LQLVSLSQPRLQLPLQLVSLTQPLLQSPSL
jgi:hypothetical protein